MIRRSRGAFGGETSREAADAAVGRGMADVLAALEDVIDDDAVLGRIYAGLESATDPARARGPAASRRRLALRAVAGAAAALVAGAVALAAIGVPGARHDGTEGPPFTAAYVVNRVDSALGAAEPGEIAQMTVTTTGGAAISGGTTTAEEWSYGDQWRSVTYSPAGYPVYDEGFSTSSVYTLVNYPGRTWARQPGMGRPAALVPPVPRSSGCEPVVAALPWLFQPRPPGPGFSASSLPSTVASALRAAISCGTLAMAGRQRVDGAEAIKLTSRASSLISETIWVSPDTYLPVRVAMRFPGMSVLQRTADITWLRPAAQNLARLTVPIPAGFRQVPLAEAGKIVP